MKLEESLKIVTIDTNYIRHLNEACSEVFYMPYGYARKPYLGILINSGGKKYVIPLTSAKEKHKSWNNVYADRMLIVEYLDIEMEGKLSEDDIFKRVTIDGVEKIKHILAAIDIKKMIPITDDVYTVININPADTDSPEEKRYKDLVTKELRFCVSFKNIILKKAENIYDKQMATGRILRFGCDFKALEEACEEWLNK